MVTPSTWLSALLLILLSLGCFAFWPNTFKRAGRWRFELFSVDFAVGALLLALIAAYTLGTLGASLGFADRLLVAGRTEQALAIIAGGAFALANMLFLSSVSLVGMAAAFPLTLGSACAVMAAMSWKTGNPLLIPVGVILVILTVALDAIAIRKRGTALAAAAANAATAASAAQAQAEGKTANPSPSTTAKASSSKSSAKAKPVKKLRISTKGILTGVIGGVALGLSLPTVYNATYSDFGLGPYGAFLLFCVGVFGATLGLNVYFMNIAIHGGPLSFNSYFDGNVQQHLMGLAGGIIWAAGALAMALALSVPAPNGLDRLLSFGVPALVAPLGLFFGLRGWHEYANAPAQAKQFLFLAVGFLMAGVVVLTLPAH